MRHATARVYKHDTQKSTRARAHARTHARARARAHTRTHTRTRTHTHPGGWTCGPAGDWVATHSLLECMQSTQTVRCRSQSLTASSRAMSVHRASHRSAAAGDRISNRRRTVSSSLISLNRYTTLKIAGAAHKLSTSQYSEHTFWKLPGAGHKMTIKLVTLTKVCDPFCA